MIPRSQAVELLPRDANTIDLQVQLVQSFGLPYEVVGSAASLRLRVLPPTWADSAATTAGAGSTAAPGGSSGNGGGAAELKVEGAREKEYW